jgi:hypothetical protein
VKPAGHCSDNEIPQREIDSIGGLLSTDAGDDLGRRFRDRVDRNGGLELVEEGAAVAARFGRGGAACPGVNFRRSAAMRTLESGTNPRRADSMAAVEP